MSTQFGLWPPQGRPGSSQAFGRILAALAVTAAGVISNDAFGNLSGLVHVGASGLYTFTFSFAVDATTRAFAQISPVATGSAPQAIIGAPNQVAVTTRDVAGAVADRDFYLLVTG